MLQGSCLCHSVSYQVAEELKELVFCHCSFCRKATASAFSVNARVNRAAFTIITGEEILAVYQSSPGKERFYCSNCHSQLFHKQQDVPEMLTVKMGTVDSSSQDLGQLPVRHIFEDARFDWLHDRRKSSDDNRNIQYKKE